jgi:radical SAM family uncharacterized protein/radical SAM-linked protein
MRHIYADFIEKVARPARYLGGEYLSVVKDASAVEARIALAFPDVYEIGMSHMGTKILYKLLNDDPRIAAERAFTPWVDMEEQLRERALPLVSLESQTPLREFDAIGISLQYELTFTNVLTLLDLGGMALRAADRKDADPLVLGGGPVATHPEPMAPFFDAFFIGEAEEELPELLLAWSAMRRAGRARRDALAELAARFPLYVPSLYATETDAATGMTVVGAPLDPRVPARVRRGVVQNIDDYPFPSDTPVPYAEAVFDRAGVEIARGCTEGCRFCQAGMIYRPVRERSPDSIVESLVSGVDVAGYDETSLTSLSTADYACITPLVKRVMSELRERKVSLSVSSLRAYGLGEDILDEMASMRITGLTFAPEAGTQRMRDVVNKNVAESHIEESTHRVFERGWHRLKLYFMIGLPTEQDEDVVGTVQTGQRMLHIGRRYVGRKAEVTVSVSSHVPKPHTPFQWCAQDPVGEIRRKQRLLRDAATDRGLKLKYHDCGISFVEGVFSRGDRRIAEAVEQAWRRGARFDGWDELFDLERWLAIFAELGIDTGAYLDTRPISARLPWDHIDVGLEDGFLLAEYRKALKNRLSPPCGKVRGELIHPANVRDAEADDRKLVCYDCGVACDLAQMREERLVNLRQLGAMEPQARAAAPAAREAREAREARRPRHPRPKVSFPERESARFRVRFAKTGRAAFLGHLDTARGLARLFRRAQVPLAYSRGFHPKPQMQFGPALSLGIPALGELLDVAVEGALGADEIAARLAAHAPDGLAITGVWPLGQADKGLGKAVTAYDLAIAPAPDDRPWDEARLGVAMADFLAVSEAPVIRGDKEIDVRPLVRELALIGETDAAKLCTALDWSAAPALVRARVAVTHDGSAKPVEVAVALGLAGSRDPRAEGPRIVRLGLVGAGQPGLADPLTSLVVHSHEAGGAGAASPTA